MRVRRALVALLGSALLGPGCVELRVARLVDRTPLTRSADPIQIVGPSGRWSAARSERASRQMIAEASSPVLDDYLGLSARLIDEPLLVGNRVDLLVDGPATYAAMFEALGAARRSIELQSYIFDDVESDGVRLVDVLAERVAAGVRIRVLVDGVGSLGSGETLERLRAAGVETCVFNPVGGSFFDLGRLNHRDHRKIVAVDGDDAFAGGINFSRVYRNGSSLFSRRSRRTLDDGWRDTHVRVRGPGAHRLRTLFFESWRKQGCFEGENGPDAGVVRASFEDSDARAGGGMSRFGGTVIQVVPSSPDSERNSTYVSVLGAVASARRSIWVTMAYFVPDERLEDELRAAARRGVDVRLILPSFSDFAGVFYAGRAHYAALLAAGVRIYEQENAFLHAKTVVVDGLWSTVGSTNWDWRSFVLNDEISVVVIDTAFAARMRALFLGDLRNSVEVTRSDWRRRGAKERLLEGFWVGFERLL